MLIPSVTLFDWHYRCKRSKRYRTQSTGWPRGLESWRGGLGAGILVTSGGRSGEFPETSSGRRQFKTILVELCRTIDAQQPDWTALANRGEITWESLAR